MSSHLIACIDGTWNSQFEGKPLARNATNVARIRELLVNGSTDGRMTQRVVYQPGVGTHDRRDALAGGLWGAGSVGRVREAYRFVCEHYEPGDVLSLFGFSRGAFAVRSILGVLVRVGVVRRGHLDHVAEAVAVARDRSDAGAEAGRKFNRAHCYGTRDVEVRFVGVWDTVVMHGPLFAPARMVMERITGQRLGLFDQRIPAIVRSFCHALALDEQRAAFWPWRASPDEDHRERVQEVWFAGSHADVGGGYEESRPSEFALEWMAVRAANAGLVFREMPRAGPDSHSAPLNPSRIRGWRWLASRRRVVEPEDVLHVSVEQRMRSTGYTPAAQLVESMLDRDVFVDSWGRRGSRPDVTGRDRDRP